MRHAIRAGGPHPNGPACQGKPMGAPLAKPVRKLCVAPTPSLRAQPPEHVHHLGTGTRAKTVTKTLASLHRYKEGTRHSGMTGLALRAPGKQCWARPLLRSKLHATT